MISFTSLALILFSVFPSDHVLLLLMIWQEGFEGSKAGGFVLICNHELIAAGKPAVGIDIKPLTTQ